MNLFLRNSFHKKYLFHLVSWSTKKLVKNIFFAHLCSFFLYETYMCSSYHSHLFCIKVCGHVSSWCIDKILLSLLRCCSSWTQTVFFYENDLINGLIYWDGNGMSYAGVGDYKTCHFLFLHLNTFLYFRDTGCNKID